MGRAGVGGGSGGVAVLVLKMNNKKRLKSLTRQVIIFRVFFCFFLDNCVCVHNLYKVCDMFVG